MVGARSLACLVGAAAGCLAAPPAADEVACAPILRNRFDDSALWKAYNDPGAVVSREANAVWIAAVPSDEQDRAYADLHSEALLPVAGTDLTAVLIVAGEGGIAGISWGFDEADGSADDDYYDFLIDGGDVHAVRKPAGGEPELLCAPGCPAYDPARHARFRLRAGGGEVVYQVSDDGLLWIDIASAPLVDRSYRSVAFAFADAPGESNLAMTEMEWAACER